MTDHNQLSVAHGAAPAFQSLSDLICHGHMAKSILITGGVRSGKSRIAESWTHARGETPVYIATAEALDAEMAERISDHQTRRGPEWRTLPAPLDLLLALHETDGTGPRLVDCLTLWLSNLMHSERDWREEAIAVAEALPGQFSPVIFVTNEVGLGIVPDNALARAFRDAQGHVNQIIAGAVDEVYLAVAGYPMKVK